MTKRYSLCSFIVISTQTVPVRDIYYNNVQLFRSQATVDRARCLSFLENSRKGS